MLCAQANCIASNKHLSWLVVLLAILSFVSAVDYSNYPACAQPLLVENTPIACEELFDTFSINSCLCPNADFFNTVARAIYSSCGDDDLRSSANAAYTNCFNTATSLAITVEQMISRGEAAGTATSPTASAMATPEPTTFLTATKTTKSSDPAGVSINVAGNSDTVVVSSGDNTSIDTGGDDPSAKTGSGGHHGYTEDQKIALGVGIGIGLPATLAALCVCILRNR